MKQIRDLGFVLSDVIDGEEISPGHVPLGLLKEFADDVGRFVAGSKKDVQAASLVVAIREGSLELDVSHVDATLPVWTDLNVLKDPRSLQDIDPQRAAIVQKWQAQARKYPNRRVLIREASDGSSNSRVLLTVTTETDFRAKDAGSWVNIERYIKGKVVDMGGASAVNLHVRMEDGATLKIDATEEELRREEENHLYRSVLLRVNVEENLSTGELRNARFIAFAPYRPKFDAAEFEEMTRRGSLAWRDVDNATDWVDELRGGSE
jgi:hypothetical protein